MRFQLVATGAYQYKRTINIVGIARGVEWTMEVKAAMDLTIKQMGLAINK